MAYFNQIPVFGDPSHRYNTAFSLKIIQVRSGKTGPQMDREVIPNCFDTLYS
jgi:hypothetical protein